MKHITQDAWTGFIKQIDYMVKWQYQAHLIEERTSYYLSHFKHASTKDT